LFIAIKICFTVQTLFARASERLCFKQASVRLQFVCLNKRTLVNKQHKRTLALAELEICLFKQADAFK
jgi:hypothetical protein